MNTQKKLILACVAVLLVGGAGWGLVETGVIDLNAGTRAQSANPAANPNFGRQDELDKYLTDFNSKSKKGGGCCSGEAKVTAEPKKGGCGSSAGCCCAAKGKACGCSGDAPQAKTTPPSPAVISATAVGLMGQGPLAGTPALLVGAAAEAKPEK